MKKIATAAFAAMMIFTACKKDDTPVFNNEVKAPLSIEFDNIAGSSDLQLNTGAYTNASGESFTVSKLKYYVSNVKLVRADATTFTVPQDSSYFLIDESHPDKVMLSVPEGEYTTLSFILGVDSLRSTMDISKRTGALDPVADGGDMYWGWNSGYIFFKMEGVSASSTAAGGSFMYHIGGFGGYSSTTLNNLRTITIDLTARGIPKVKAGKSTNVHLLVDVLKMFNGPTNISIAANPVVMFEPLSAGIAGNYVSMFRHDHTEN